MSGSIHWGPHRVRSIHDRIGVASRTARLMLAELRRLLRPHATPAARQRSRSEGAEGLFEYPIAVKARVSARKWIPASEWLQLARASLLRQVWTVCKESISRIRFASANGRYLRIPAKDPRRFGSPSGRRSNRVRFSPLGVPESLKSSEQHLLFVVRHLIEDIHIRFELPALACPSLDREWRSPLQLEQRKARGRYS